MQDDPNTDTESPPLDHEDWSIVFRAYAQFPILGFILAQHLDCLKTFIQRKSEIEAISALDQAIDCLMPHTHYKDAPRSVYLLAVAGDLPPGKER